MRRILALLILLAIPAVAQFGGPMGGMRPGSMQGGGLLPGRGGDPLWVAAGPTKPTLDFDFAGRKDLTDAVSSDTSLITFSRSAAQSPGTYVGADGLIHDAAVNLALYSERFDTLVFSKVNSAVSANQATAPDGKQTADKIQATGSPAYVSQALTLSSSKVYTISAYLKSDSANTWVRLGHDSSGSNAAWFDLQNGTIGTVNDDANQANIENVGNGWYRCSLVIASGKGSAAVNFVGLSSSDGGTSGTGSESVFVWGFQIEETDAATMQPTAYIHTTSQALAAPRFDHVPTTGNLTTNLLTYSEMLDNAAWSKAGAGTASAPQVVANNAVSPNADLTADKITLELNGGTASGDYSWIYQNHAAIASTTYTFSVYVKAATPSDVGKQFRAGFTTYSDTVTLTDAWQRVEITQTASASTT